MTLSKEQYKAIVNKKKTSSPQKEALKNNVTFFCKINKLTLEEEKIFYKGRKWRFDFFIPQLNVAIEYEGIKIKKEGDKSRHTTITGYTGDAEKYNHAALLGIRVLRFTFKNHASVLDYLNKIKSI